MSLAGVRSSRGDEFQLAVALHWLIRLLEEEVIGIQVESTGIPGDPNPVVVDDIVVIRSDKLKTYIQAKLSAPNLGLWNLNQRQLQDELVKAGQQLESDCDGQVCFYSQSPFGKLQRVCEDSGFFPDYISFQRDASAGSRASIKRLAKVFERTEEQTFGLARRITFGSTRTLEDWASDNLSRLRRIVPNSLIAVRLLERLLSKHQTKLGKARILLRRQDVVGELATDGFYLLPAIGLQSILGSFSSASRIGRSWIRDIRGVEIVRPELKTVLALVESGARSIIVTDQPGSGKTCLLLSLVDHFEAQVNFATLFIRGDNFNEAKNESDLVQLGLPEDLPGRCCHLAQHRRVLVVVDSLDVLSFDRSHGALKLFLGIIERIRTIPRVTVVAACRSFDLEYDSLLRSMTWEHRVAVGPLSFEETVSPLLRSWGHTPEALSGDVRALLCNPYQLRIFAKAALPGISLRGPLASDLHDLYITEAIEKDSALGRSVVEALEQKAEELTHQRTQRFPRCSIKVSEQALQRLMSEEVLLEPNIGVLCFAHQTLTETFAVRSALAKGVSLTGLIQSYEPLPFIRPVVRSYFFHLRTCDPKRFRQESLEAILDGKNAYHLKRLLAESLAEIAPTEEDWPLIRQLFQNAPDLFRRTLSLMRGPGWFVTLTKSWLEIALTASDRQSWLYAFVCLLDRWLDTETEQVIALWTRAINSKWSEHIAWHISVSLGKLEDWNGADFGELFSALLDSGNAPDVLSKPLSRWITAKDTGDVLLWRFLTEPAHKARTQNGGPKLRGGAFESADFLIERFGRSDSLLTLTIDSLLGWASVEQWAFDSPILRETSWKFRHTRHSTYPVNDITLLVSALEPTLKNRARNNDTWWRTNEPRLRRSTDLGIRYMLLAAYLQNAECNVAGIEDQLLDGVVDGAGNLDDELRELTTLAFHLISEEAQVRYQILVTALYEPSTGSGDGYEHWRAQRSYQFLLSIPCCLRLRDSQEFLDRWEGLLGRARSEPQILMWGGLVSPPVSAQFIAICNDEEVIRLLRHYEHVSRSERSFGTSMVGGRSQLVQELDKAASLDPGRFLNLCLDCGDIGLGEVYQSGIFQGISEHVRIRCCKLSPNSDWHPKEPLPNLNLLAWELLRFVEGQVVRLRELDSRSVYAVARVLEGCTCVAINDEFAERVTIALCPLLVADDPTSDSTSAGIERRDFQNAAWNTVRGIAAESAAVLLSGILESGLKVPRLLPCLLRRFARDSNSGVQFSVLRHIPYLIHLHRDLGWQLMADAFAERKHLLWCEAERVLYFNYAREFVRVAPYLCRMREEALDVAGEAYGRLLMLAVLGGHIGNDELKTLLAGAPAEVHKGVVQVLWSNLSDPRHTERCLEGLLAALARPGCGSSLVDAVAFGFRSKDCHPQISLQLVQRILEYSPEGDGMYRLWGISEWLDYKARVDPASALGVFEQLVSRLQLVPSAAHHLESRSIVSALLQIQREADALDDPEFIHRTIVVQDQLLQFGITEIDQLLDRASYA